MVGTGAVGIRRWVFEKISEQVPGHPPFWQKVYELSNEKRGEDWYFAQLCEKAGIQQYVHTGLETPHIGWHMITKEDWWAWCEVNQDQMEIKENKKLWKSNEVKE